MSLNSGTRLGPYELVAPIGAGGMGEVYRARDTRLHRTVAVKVLLSHLAADSERRQRFEREARAVSGLNHPHICVLHDIGQEHGVDYLVMEYLEGENLAQRLQRGPLPLEQVLRYGVQIGGALDQAHVQGVYHRDLKPSNIMLTRSGAKLLDFGLAKLREPEGTSATGSRLSTLTSQGTILGTAHYMAPEQLEGRAADGRTDIFTFGAVLHEMVTGRKAFDGASSASVITAILSRDPPPVSTVVKGRFDAPALDRVIQRCLAKNPDDRWQSARDLTAELEWIAQGGTSSPEGATGRAGDRPTGRRERAAWIGLTVVLLALLGLVYWMRPAPLARTARFLVAPPEQTSLAGSIAVSPDGRQLAFTTTTPEGSTALWVRSLDAIEARRLPGAEGAVHPFWSPDSRFLGFFAENKLKKIRVEGGPPQVLCDVFDARGGTWNSEGVIVFSPNPGDRLHRIAEAGGAPSPVTALSPSRQESSHQWPHFLPDNRHFLYLVWSAKADARGIYVGSLNGGEPRRVAAADWRVTYAQGYLFFLRGRTLLAQRFDTQSFQVRGEPVPVADDVWYDETTPGLTSFSLSDSGVLAYRSGGLRTTQLTWFDRSGRPLGTAGPPGANRDPWLSPEEKRVVVSRLDPQTGTQDLWLLEMERGTASRLTFHPANEATPLWSPDGNRLVFSTDRDGPPNLYQKAAGGGEEEPLLRSTVSKYPTGWTGDGRHLVFAQWDPKTKWDLWVLAMGREPGPYLQTEFDSFQAQFSPDGRWIAYASNESNPHYEVYVQPFPMAAGKWQISTKGGAQPSWRRDGRELYYLSADRRLMAVEIRGGATLQPGVPQPLFQTRVTGLVDSRNHYLAASDGRRFLVNTIVGEPVAAPITVALDGTAALKKP